MSGVLLTLAQKRWSQHVTETSNPLDLDQGVFTWSDPEANRGIAETVRRVEQASQGVAVKICNVDAKFLYQPRRRNLDN